MANSLPSSASKANCDSTSDNPQLALTSDLAGLVDKFNSLLTVTKAVALTNISNGLTAIDNGAGTADDLAVECEPFDRTGSVSAPSTNMRGRVNYYTPATVGNKTFVMGAASTYGANWYTYVANGSDYKVTLGADGSETINGVSTIALQPQEGGMLICTGSGWIFVGNAAGSVELAHLADVDESITPSDGDVLMWDSVASKWQPDGTLQNNGLIECQQSTTTSEQTGTSTYATYLTKTVTNLVAGDRIVVFATVYYYASLTSDMDTEPQMRITNSTDAETLRESETTGITAPQSNAGQLVPIILTGRTSAIGSSADRTITMEVRGRGDVTGGGFLRFAFGNLFCFIERPAS